jgi:hypothetical protein
MIDILLTVLDWDYPDVLLADQLRLQDRADPSY